MGEIQIIVCLLAIMGLVLILPFSVRWIEEELEAFLLGMGALAVTVSGQWSLHLVREIFVEPIRITLAVFIFGLTFRRYRIQLRRKLVQKARSAGLRYFIFVLVAALGVLSSVITAIVAALILIEVVSGLKLEKRLETQLVVLSCYSIGLGAVLTPIGEPLSTIATVKLAGVPHNADFFFLARLLWPWVASGILLTSLLASWCCRSKTLRAALQVEIEDENLRNIAARAAKVYLFVGALVLLGAGFAPIVDRYLVNLSGSALYWMNMVSAVLDNATLCAAEISPQMAPEKIKFILMGLLLSGGMLIPGNIPNIICAKHLRISSGDWAIFGVPLGLLLMVSFFILFRFVL